jgi:hypothetical protein
MNMWKRYLSPTPANVARIMLIVEGCLGIAIGSQWAEGRKDLALGFAVAGYVLNKLSAFLTEKPNGLLEDKNLRGDDTQQS